MAIPYDRKTPHRFDIVGSFLRPAALKRARADFEAGTIDRAALTAIEDREIRALIGREKEAGLGVITDGELRRGSWHLDFMWPFEGVGHHRTTTGLPFHGEAAMVDDTFLTGPVAAPAHHPFVDHFKFVQAQEDERTVAKQTIPAPAQFYAQFAMPFSWQLTHAFYDAPERLIDDIVVAYRQVIGELYAAGCRNLQLDDCTWPMTVDENARQFWGDDLDAVRQHLLAANNRVLEALPADLTVNTHICRGNFHSTYACSGPYDDVAPVVFAHENVTAFFLEFDDERSGGFAPLGERARRQGRGAGPDHLKASPPGGQGCRHRAHPRGVRVPSAGEAGAQPAVWLLVDGGGQQAYRRGPVEEAGAREGDRRGGLGLAPALHGS